MSEHMNDLSNMKFGMLKVLRKNGSNHYGILWECECECGNTLSVTSARLKNGTYKSCGCSKTFERLDGKKFNKLTVLQYDGKRKNDIMWKCECECGKTTRTSSHALKSGHTTSCGCYLKKRIKETRTKNLIGNKFGRLLVIELDDNQKDDLEYVHWKCKCECGNVASIRSASLISGNTKSCGCLINEMKKENHPRWKREISSKERELGKRRWNTDAHKKWRNLIFFRDNHKCQVSGQIGGQLVAHHIRSWDNDKILRFDVSNGITVSRKIHIQFHKKYGYGKNDEKQWKEFIYEYKNTNKNS